MPFEPEKGGENKPTRGLIGWSTYVATMQCYRRCSVGLPRLYSTIPVSGCNCASASGVSPYAAAAALSVAQLLIRPIGLGDACALWYCARVYGGVSYCGIDGFYTCTRRYCSLNSRT